MLTIYQQIQQAVDLVEADLTQDVTASTAAVPPACHCEACTGTSRR
ncbi:MAG: hypothetical protein QNJ89_12625 [Acidimicrobiia bacterium]|nr:hypothetical protein [Acidimicrobiia bacterium]